MFLAKTVLIAAAVATSQLALAPPAGLERIPESPRATPSPTLQRVVRQLVRDGAPGALAVVRSPSGVQHATAGLARRRPRISMAATDGFPEVLRRSARRAVTASVPPRRDATPQPDVHYGFGLLQVDTRCGRVYGHQGDLLGYRTIVYMSPDGARVALVMVNVDRTYVTQTELERAAETTFCRGVAAKHSDAFGGILSPRESDAERSGRGI